MSKGLETLVAPRSGALRVAARFVRGRPLDGRRRSDATFWARGRSYVDGPGWHSRWHLAPGVVVLAVRLAALYAVLVLLKGWVRDPAAAAGVFMAVAGAVRSAAVWLGMLWRSPVTALTTLGVAARVVGVLVAVVVVGKVARWRHDREVVRPFAVSVAGPLGYSTDAPHRPWLRVPRVLAPSPPLAARVAAGRVRAGARAWLEDREGPRWRRVERWMGTVRAPSWWARSVGWVALRWLPVHAWRVAHSRVWVAVPHELGSVDPKIRSAVMGSVGAKLSGDWASSWELSGSRPRLVLRAREHPPRLVTFADALPFLEIAPADDLLIGLGVGRRPSWWTPECDSPHALLSMGSGAGKSVLLRLLAVQALHKGWAVVLLDFKQDHYWAQELIDAEVPGLWYFRKTPDIHAALIGLEAVREWRSDVDFEHRGKMPMQRTLILFEEMNATVTALRSHWSQVKAKGDPGKSPALTAFGSLSAAGRSAKMHLIAVGQYLTAQVFGGPEARENFGMRTLGRYTPAAWRTLVPEHTYVPKSTIRGRVQVCSADERREAQVPLLTQDECVAWARGGLAGVVPSGMLPFAWDVEALAAGGRSGLRLAAPPPAALSAPEPRALVGLSMACAPGGPLDGMSIHAARKARQRDDVFPQPAPEPGPGGELLYSRAALGEWAAGRSIRGQSTDQAESDGESADTSPE